MPANGRSRAPRQPYLPDDDDIVETRSQRRDPRRRTPYVPRQQASRPLEDDYPDDPQPPQRGTRRRRQQPQQPAWRRSREEPLNAAYDAYDEDVYADELADDRVIGTGRTPSRQRAAPSGRGRAGSRGAPPAEYIDAYDDYDEYDDSFDDGFIDEDDWYEEEATAGAYRRRQRSTRAASRPSVSLPRPTIPQVTLPRPTVPLAVREAALVQDRESVTLIGILVVSVIGMVIVTMARVDSLAPGFATHISASGVKEEFRSESALWQLPLMAGALLLMNVVLAWFLAVWSTFSARFVLVASIIVQVVIWVALLRLAF